MPIFKRISIAVTGFYFFLAAKVSAAGPEQLPNPLKTTSIYDILGRVIKAALGLTGAVALVMFIYGGFLMMFSGGNPSAVKKGKDTLVMAVLGLVVIFASYAIVNFVITSITK